MRRTTLLTLLAALAAGAVMSPSAAGAAGTVQFDSVPEPLPGSVASLGFDGDTDEYGQILQLVSPGPLASVTVTLVSAACQEGFTFTTECRTTLNADGTPPTYEHPVTVNLYAVGGSTEAGAGPGELIGTVTQTIAVPYRPSSDPGCATRGGGWSTSCFSGYAFNATFDFSALHLSLPDELIATVTFDTELTGRDPIGTAGPWDWLRIGVTESTPAVGTYGDAYLDYRESPDSVGIQNFDAFNYTMMIRLESTPSAPQTSADCKNGGFATFGFSNQGQCIASVNANENAGR